MAQDITNKIKKSLKYSVIDGTFYCIMTGFGESFFSAFAVFLKATTIEIGLLGSLPQALGSISQLASNKFIHLFKSRKKMICTSAFMHAMMHLLILLVFFMGKYKTLYLLVFVSLYWIFAAFPSAAWNSWMGDLVDEDKRGTYFGKRNRIAGIAAFFALLFAGIILQKYSGNEIHEYMGFAIIFTIALFARLISTIYLSKKYEPKYEPEKKSEFTFLEFLKQVRHTRFGIFVLYCCFMNFGVFLAAPFFAAYMLKDLQMDYWTFTLITGTALIVKFLFMPMWGKIIDRYGTKKVLAISGFMMPILPILWLFNTNFWYLIAVQAVSGFALAGFELASFNYLYDTTSKEKRATCIAYYNVINGITIFFAALLGGIIVKYNTIFWSKYLLIFLISGIIRYLATFIFITKIKEVKDVEHIPYNKLILHVLTTLPNQGIVHEIITLGEKHTKETTRKTKKMVKIIKKEVKNGVKKTEKVLRLDRFLKFK